MRNPPWPSDWMRATLGLCALKALDAGASYGYAIASDLESRGFGAVKGGTLYPLLARFEAAGWVTTRWQAGEGGPGRKYFSLTPDGQRELREQSTRWTRFASTVENYLDQQGHDGSAPGTSTPGSIPHDEP